MAAGSQPASMPAESNLDPMIQIISPARPAIFEIDPSWADRALAAGSEGTSPQHGVPEGTAMCANPHTPVSGSLAGPSQVPTVEQAAAAERAAKSAAKVARRKQRRAEQRREQLLLALVGADGTGAALLAAEAERDELRGQLGAIRDALAAAQLRHAAGGAAAASC